MVSLINQSSVMVAFSALPDPRKPRNQLYSLLDIVTTSILASLCGADDCVAISFWAEENLDWLQSIGVCLQGAPAHDTYERFFMHLNPGEFERRFMQWTQIISNKVAGVLAIDGKTLCNSGDEGQDPIHMISAFAAENSLVLGQLKTSGKGKELEGFQLILDLLDLKGMTVTIDAGGCHRVIAKKIVGKGGDYVLHLKGNQGKLHAEVVNFFDQAEKVSPQESGCDYWCSEERSRGRLERREVWACGNLDWLPQRDAWKGLSSVACVVSTRIKGEKSHVERRYYISSCRGNADYLGQAIRSHWSVENQLHWHLDVTFGEDRSRMRKNNSAENFSILRRATLNILRRDNQSKYSLKKRRLKAGWNRDYLTKLMIS